MLFIESQYNKKGLTPFENQTLLCVGMRRLIVQRIRFVKVLIIK